VHTYPHTSALTASGAYRAELRVVGKEKVARADVTAEWTLIATPDRGDAPLDVTFDWSGFDPVGAGFSCRLEPGDGSAAKVIDDCLTTTTATHRYTARGGFTATLIVTGALRQDLKSVAVTVGDAVSCPGIADLAALLDASAWTGRITYAFDQTAGDGIIVQVQRSGDFTFRVGGRVERRRDGNLESVRWSGGTVTGGTSSMYDAYDWGGPTPATWTGSGTPDLVIIEFEIDVGACTYGLMVLNSQRGTHTSGGDGRHGSNLYVIDHALAVGGVSRAMSVPSVFFLVAPEEHHFSVGGGYATSLKDLVGDWFDRAEVSWNMVPVGP
jgi:hypothetical protein